MAVYNEIGIGRWNRFIQKLTDMKGGPPARQLSSEIAFSHPIFHGAENRYLESWQTYGACFDIAAVAANVGGCKLRNPAGSNVVAVFAKISIAAVASQQFNINFAPSAVDLGTINTLTNARLDPRGNQTPAIIASSQASTPGIPAMGILIDEKLILANTCYDLIFAEHQEIPLLPGDAIQIFGALINTRFVCSFLWRERFLEPAERI